MDEILQWGFKKLISFKIAIRIIDLFIFITTRPVQTGFKIAVRIELQTGFLLIWSEKSNKFKKMLKFKVVWMKNERKKVGKI